MLFHVTHRHSHETCPAVFSDRAEALASWWRSVDGSTEVRVVSATAAPLDHVLYLTLEAPDLEAVVRALGPLSAIGTAETSPVIPVAELVSMLQSR